METPSQKLAGLIINKIIDSGLIEKNDAEKMKGNLAAGKVKAEDWKLAVEKQIERSKSK